MRLPASGVRGRPRRAFGRGCARARRMSACARFHRAAAARSNGRCRDCGRRDAILHAASALTDPHGDAAGTDCGLAAVSAVTGLALPALRKLAAGVGRPARSLTVVDLAAVLSAVGVACRVAVPQVNPRQWVPGWRVAWYPSASTLAVVRLRRSRPSDPLHWVAVRGDWVADGIGRLTPAGEYWDRHADACAELVRLGGVDTGGGLVPPLCVARMVRRAVDGGVVVRGRLEHAASVSALCVDVRAEVGPDGAKFVFPQPCADCGGAVALGADSLPGCRDCRSLFDWESGNGRA